MFPDRSLIGKSDWCDCCVAHDLAYWRGGTAEERLKADRELKACVLAKTSNEKLADVMFAGVRTGGGPYFYTHYRWGYGWPYGRGYAPLTPEEKEMAKEGEKKYFARAPSPSCPAK